MSCACSSASAMRAGDGLNAGLPAFARNALMAATSSPSAGDADEVFAAERAAGVLEAMAPPAKQITMAAARSTRRLPLARNTTSTASSVAPRAIAQVPPERTAAVTRRTNLPPREPNSETSGRQRQHSPGGRRGLIL